MGNRVNGEWIYRLLDAFFLAAHTAFIAFVLVGWIWVRTVRLHLFLVGLTAFSWFGLGLWYGIGYCPCTDWHWAVRARLGRPVQTYSYIKFVIDSFLGTDLSSDFADRLTLLTFLLVLGLSFWRFFRSRESTYKRKVYPNQRG